MTLRFHREIDLLKTKILELGALVEQAIRLSVIAIDESKPGLARQVIEQDHAIDQLEIILEEDCLKLLALHQPVAQDLRLIITVLKMNNDLERMGDLAVNIAERTLYLSSKERLAPPFDIARMGAEVRKMVKSSLDSLVNDDDALARQVILHDDVVDDMNRKNYASVIDEMKEDSHRIARCMHYVSVSGQLERIADLATNIAQDVVYLVEGEIIRHKATLAAESSVDDDD